MTNRADVQAELRALMRRGATPSELLRTIVARHKPEDITGWQLMHYLMEVFSLPLNRASAVNGWRPDGSGEVSDARIDVLLLPSIIQSAPSWDTDDGPGSEGNRRWFGGLSWPAEATAAQVDAHRFGLSNEAWAALSESDRQILHVSFASAYRLNFTAEYLATLAETLQRRINELEDRPPA